jgi:hypothetical protein
MQRNEAAALRYATALARLQKASGDGAGAIETYRLALSQMTPGTLEAIRAETLLTQAMKAQGDGAAVLPRTIAGLSHEAASFAVQSLTMGGAVGVATAAINSFVEAFKFKAELDATTKSIEAQMTGVRNVPAVFASAQSYAERYKITQQDLTGALQAAIPIMRNSRASTEEILSTLQRLTILNPAENIQGAAFALKELQAGQTTSIADRFNISLSAAGKLKAEIQGGGDAVKVLGKYLDSVNASTTALDAQMSGPTGKMKDLTRQEEALKLAQAQWAMGPGLAVLELQTRSLTGLTRILSGDWGTMGQSASDGFETITLAAYNAGRQIKITREEWDRMRGNDLRAASAAQPAPEPIPVAQLQGAAAPVRDLSDAFTSVHLSAAEAASGVNNLSSEFLTQATAIQTVSQATQDAIAKQADAIGQDREMAGYKQELAYLGGQVAAGLLSSGAAALRMAQDYGIATGQAAALVAQQAALANKPTEARQERDTTADHNAARAAGAALQKSQVQLQRDIVLATGSTAEKLAIVNQQIKEALPTSAESNRLIVQRATLTMQLAAEHTKAGTAADKLATKDAAAANAEAVALRDAQRRIETLYRDHYEKLRGMAEDYALSESRKLEDYNEKRQRLLAEGKILEAGQLQKEYEKQKRRDAEDRAIAVRRQDEGAAQQVADARQQAGLKADDRERKRLLGGVALPGDAAGAGASAASAAATGAPMDRAQAALAAAASASASGGTLRIEFAPITLSADGVALANVVYPTIETRLDSFLAGAIATIRVTAPPGGQTGVGGPRP